VLHTLVLYALVCVYVYIRTCIMHIEKGAEKWWNQSEKRMLFAPLSFDWISGDHVIDRLFWNVLELVDLALILLMCRCTAKSIVICLTDDKECKIWRTSVVEETQVYLFEVSTSNSLSRTCGIDLIKRIECHF